jgi:hypothetical protein
MKIKIKINTPTLFHWKTLVEIFLFRFTISVAMTPNEKS